MSFHVCMFTEKGLVCMCTGKPHYHHHLHHLWIVGCIPRGWKQAIVFSIFKKGSQKLPSNYRPVSLTSVCCKVMESIVYDSMISFLHCNNLISKYQFGFLARRTQLLATLNEWKLFTDSGSKN